MPTASMTAEFSRIFSAEFQYVWGTLRRLGAKPGDVEDLVHDVFVQVYKKLDAYDASRPVRPWLFGFAFRVASDYRRLARHRVELLGHEHDPPAAANPADEAIANAEELLLVEEALAAIDLDRRAVLVAFELDGAPMKEVADALGIPLNTAYSRLRMARQEFAAHVRKLRLRRGER